MNLSSTCSVVFPIPVDRVFTYHVPESLAGVIRPGFRVLAPFGRKKITGFVIGSSDSVPPGHARAVTEVLDTFPVFPEDLLRLARWISDYYMAPLGQVLGIMLPPGLDKVSQRVVSLKSPISDYEIHALRRSKPLQARILKALYVYRELSWSALQKKTGSAQLIRALEELTRLGIVEVRESYSEPGISVLYEKMVSLDGPLLREPEALESTIEQFERRSPKQADILRLFLERWLENGEELPVLSQRDVLESSQAGLSSLKALVARGLLIVSEIEKVRDPFTREFGPPEAIAMNPDQERAVDAIARPIADRTYATFLLHGITASGKTQVYIEAMKQTLAQGRSAIVLVPEIALTPQTVERFKSHFGSLVTVWHSAMSAGERFDSWRKIHRTDFRVVIGARSAVFAPVKDLGLVVVDEEHENTYKQSDTTPRYHARDVAVVRGTLSGAVVILGSATPALESYANAENGKYTLLELPRRINDVPLPSVRVIDMRQERRIHTEGWEPVLSKELRDAMQQTIDRNHQIILFQNRRGYASFLACVDCGFVPECPHCSLSLTYHRHKHRLRCHYCGYSSPAPSACPACGNPEILRYGIGTQKVETVLEQTFPRARALRMDLDTTIRKGAHERILDGFRRGDASILLGTQMVAKGLDFEKVTLVGVISADTSLLLPDFRSSERTFQLLTQVAGRAGRKNNVGRVIVQTLHPERPAIRYAQNHDYRAFYREEMAFRRELLYPPFGRLYLVVFRGSDEKKVVDQSGRFSDILLNEIGVARSALVLGPAPAPIVKVRNFYRWHILLKTDRQHDKGGTVGREILRKALTRYRSVRDGQDHQIIVDVDPVSVL